MCVCVRARVCVYVRVCARACVYVREREKGGRDSLSEKERICVCVCVRVCVCVCVCVCVYMCEREREVERGSERERGGGLRPVFVIVVYQHLSWSEDYIGIYNVGSVITQGCTLNSPNAMTRGELKTRAQSFSEFILSKYQSQIILLSVLWTRLLNTLALL